MEIGIYYGLMTMLSWGVADFIQSIAVRRIGSAKTLVIRNIFTLVIALTTAVVLESKNILIFDIQAFGIVALSSVFYVWGYFAYLRGYEVGNITLVAPIASSFAIVTVLLSVIFTHETLSFVEGGCIIMIVGGLFLTAAKLNQFRHLHSQRGLKESLIALLTFGIAFFVLGFISKNVNAGTVFVYSALTQSILFIAIGSARKGVPVLADLTRSLVIVFLAHAVIVNLGWLAYIIGSGVSDISIVAPIASVFSGVIVVLAIVIYRERIVLSQTLGIMAILTGVFFLSQ